MTSAPLITPRGESGFLFTFQDVTELKRQDREARVQQRLAAVGEMAAGIAHEIRNPLASMAGSIQILRDELPLTTDQSQLMDIVLRESDRLNETIRNFMAFAKPQRIGGDRLRRAADRQRRGAAAREQRRGDRQARDRRGRAGGAGDVSRRRSADPADRLEPRDQRPAGDAQRRAAAARSPPTAPAPGRGRRSDRRRCTTTASGSRRRTWTASSSRSAAASGGGTGLGLSIVHRIASDYGGEVRVASEKGKGTSVEVALPVGRPTVDRVGGRRAQRSGADRGYGDRRTRDSRRIRAHPRRRRRAIDARDARDPVEARRARRRGRRERARRDRAAQPASVRPGACRTRGCRTSTGSKCCGTPAASTRR